MEKSLFFQWVQKYFPGVTLKVVEKLNDTTLPLSYLHRTMLKKDFSVSGKWESLNAANTLVRADLVAMDSSLPLKKRDAITKASGDIPKQGMELKLNEKQLTDLDTLVASGGTDSQILQKLFADTPKVIGGIYETNEFLFLQGLSTGVILVDDSNNVGTGVRLDFGYLPANKFGVTSAWGTPSTSTPFSDIQKVLDKADADGNTITKVMLNQTDFNNLAASNQAKELFAFSSNIMQSDSSKIPAPSIEQMNTFVSSRYGFVFEIVKRSVRVEKNGVQSVVKPWADHAVVFLTTDQVGSLVYAKLAEQNHPVDGVTYQLVDDFILVSKYRMNKPSLSEYTSSQARVVPVISGVDGIYTLATETVVN